MNAGAHLSHAARLAGDLQRAGIAVVAHLEMADAMLTDIESLLAEVGLPNVDVALVLEDLGEWASFLQRLADAHGRREVRLRFLGKGCAA